MSAIVLKGITWNHSRGFTPLIAASQLYNELNPTISIQWEKRSLQEFADYPLEKLALNYDLLIIDHPWVGCAAATNAVLPLNEYMNDAFINNQKVNSVGASFNSYEFQNSLWALPIDAATPVASYRKDLFEANNCSVPQTWEALIELANNKKVAVPAIPIDLLMNFYSFCLALKVPFFENEFFIAASNGTIVLETMMELYSKVDTKMFSLNPIGVAQLMSDTNDYWYCPFAYGYSNYSRNGYAKHLLQYGGVVSLHNQKLQTTIGGTGLSVSSNTQYQTEAINFATWICSENIQSTIYVQNGGQPGHLTAWQDDNANLITNNYFRNCLQTMKDGYMRPRYNGYLHFQDKAGLPLQQYLLGKKSSKETIFEMNEIYKESKLEAHVIAT
jgi:multiple sugar transport system substrate-binding protein